MKVSLEDADDFMMFFHEALGASFGSSIFPLIVTVTFYSFTLDKVMSCNQVEKKHGHRIINSEGSQKVGSSKISRSNWNWDLANDFFVTEPADSSRRRNHLEFY